jgi:hypothetical protein
MKMLGRTHKARFGGRWIALGSVVASSLYMAAPAKAALMLTLTELAGPNMGTTAPVTVSALPATPTQVIYSLPFGDFSTNINVGFSNATVGGTEAQLQVNVLDITSNTDVAGAVLQVTLTDSGFNFPGTPGTTLSLTSAVNGSTFTKSTTGDTVTFQSTAFDSSPQSVSTPLQTVVSPGGDAAASGSHPADQTVPFTRGATYGLTNVTTLTFSRAGEAENVGGTTTTLVATNVPEPTSLAMLGVSSLFLMRRRRATQR